ncbi:sce7725 family protein [Pseudomonas sp. NPDC089758]|uniref:sce7725 family protein n=1 Tax=Pseudomonas sp. NPDC089758 TaxID=3364473 RepID=UPI0037FAFCC0
MYSPYLYARQSELLALRALLKDGLDLSGLVPVLEPVIINTKGLKACTEAFADAGHPLIIATNPSHNEFKGISNPQEEFYKHIKDFIHSSPSIVPGFNLTKNTTKNEVDAFLNKYSQQNVALIHNNPSISLNEFGTHPHFPNIKYNIILSNKITSAHKGALPTLSLISVEDSFIKQAKNADYSGKEHFTDKHKTIGLDKLAYGDYTITGQKLEIGGGKPGAVTIHAIYKDKATQDIWIEHFVSEETDRNIGSVESKFLDAARKLVRETTSRPGEFSDNSALQSYKYHVANNTWPGLPKNKELQIRHHICLMLDVISGKI